MRSSKALLAVLYILYAFQCTTVEAKFGGGGRRTSSGGGRSRGSSYSSHSSHSSPSIHHTATVHHTAPISHHTSSNHGTSNFPSISSAPKPSIHSVSKPASNPIGWNVGGGNTISSGHATNNHGSYPVQSHGTTGIHDQSKASPPIHTPIQSTSQNQVHSNVHTPLQQTKQHQVQSSYPVQSYHTAHLVPPANVGGVHQAPMYHGTNTMPAGASYYPSAGAIPAGATFYPQAGMSHVPVYHAPVMALPPGATFYASPAALPVGATFYPQPPRSNSGPGFGTGLIAGAIGQSVLSRLGNNHHDRVEHHYDHNSNNYNTNDRGEDRVIIINNGPAGSVQATPVGQGTTIIQTETQRTHTLTPQYAGVPTYPNQNLNQNFDQIPPPVISDTNVYQNPPQTPQILTDDVSKVDASSNANTTTPQPLGVDTNRNTQNPPEPGRIVCIPMLVNETDPQDASNITEVEKIACFLAPTEELQANATNENAQQLPAESPFFGNDQALYKPSETLTTIDEVNKQQVSSGGINQNYKPSGSDSVQTTIIIERKKIENSSAGSHKVHIANVLAIFLVFINF